MHSGVPYSPKADCHPTEPAYSVVRWKDEDHHCLVRVCQDCWYRYREEGMKDMGMRPFYDSLKALYYDLKRKDSK